MHDGCEHVVVVLTQPQGYRKKATSKKINFIYRGVFRKYPNLVQALEERYLHYNKTVDFVEELERQGRATIIRPDGSLKLHRFEKSPAILRTLFEQGYRDASARLHSVQLQEGQHESF